MTRTFKFSAVAAIAVLAAHAAIALSAGSSLQSAADLAVMPVVKADKIVVTGKALAVVKADKITVTAKRPATGTLAHTMALTSWNVVA